MPYLSVHWPKGRAPTAAKAAGLLMAVWCVPLALAQDSHGGHVPKAVPTAKVALPPGVTEAMLAPPPMPRFMLDKNAQKLTPRQMATEAEEASRVAKAVVAMPAGAPSQPATARVKAPVDR